MIRIERLKICLAGAPVLSEVSLRVPAGETLALMGASGSGKSTLLRAAVGLLAPDSGQVWLCGRPVVGAGGAGLREVRREAGMLFQGNALFDSMTATENIGFILREVMGMSEEDAGARVDTLLDRLHLGPIGHMYPAELSGGMKRRVGIARAVAHEPSVLFYDDPTAGLDPITSDVIADLILELGASEERASMVVSNYLPLINKVAHNVALLHEGRVMELGTPEKMMESGRVELMEFLEPEGLDR